MTDTDDVKRRILERVADGSLSPSEAAEQLAGLDADPTGADGPPTDGHDDGTTGGMAGAAPRPAPAAAAYEGPVREVKIRGMFRPVEIVGDPSVHEAVAEGRHTARMEGDVLVIDGGGVDFDDEDDDGEDDWFRFARGTGLRYRRMGVRLRSSAGLEVRMNPDLALDARVEAGPLNIRQVHGPIRARVAAGPLKISEFEGPLDLHVAAGPIKARGVLDHGDSRIQCEAGSVHLHLESGSSVRVSAAATLGKVHLFGDRDHDRGRDRSRGRDFHWEDLAGPGVGRVVGDVLGKLGGNQEATIGGGEGSLDVEVSMGAVHISAD